MSCFMSLPSYDVQCRSVWVRRSVSQSVCRSACVAVCQPLYNSIAVYIATHQRGMASHSHKTPESRTIVTTHFLTCPLMSSSVLLTISFAQCCCIAPYSDLFCALPPPHPGAQSQQAPQLQQAPQRQVHMTHAVPYHA